MSDRVYGQHVSVVRAVRRRSEHTESCRPGVVADQKALCYRCSGIGAAVAAQVYEIYIETSNGSTWPYVKYSVCVLHYSKRATIYSYVNCLMSENK